MGKYNAGEGGGGEGQQGDQADPHGGGPAPWPEGRHKFK